MNDNNSLAHTTWNCKYHIEFAPKYRRKVLLQENHVEMSKILRGLCEWKGIKIIEAEICPNHVHMFVEIPPKMSVSSFMGYLKGKSSVIFHERHGNLKFKYYIGVWCGFGMCKSHSVGCCQYSVALNYIAVSYHGVLLSVHEGLKKELCKHE